MLKVRVIPTLLWKEFGLVKGIAFDSQRRVGPVLQTIKVYNQREVDEIIILDIQASKRKIDPDYSSIAEFTRGTLIPTTIGGGIANIDQVRYLLRSGADKVSLNSALYDEPGMIDEIAKTYGSQCLVVSIDVRKSTKNHWKIYSHSGEREISKDLFEWIKEVENRGAGEVLLTSIDRDGTMTGYDQELLETVSNILKIPLIASGGASNYQDMIDAVKNGGASAVAAASIFHFTELTPKGAKMAMAEAGIATRTPFVDLLHI